MLPAFLLLATFITLVPLVALFNRMARAVNRVEQQWADVDVMLRRRADVTANLVETVRGYAEQESEVLVRASRARSMLAATTSVADKGHLLDELENAITGVLLLAESYPDLKAVESFLALLKALETSENLLLASRQEYNEAVRSFNTMRESLPTNVLSRMKRFAAREYFQASPGSGHAPTLGIRPPNN